MSIKIYSKNSNLILEYFQEFVGGDVEEKLSSTEGLFLRKIFHLKNKNLIPDENGDDIYRFIIGTLNEGFYELDKEVFGIKNKIFFAANIKFDKRFFIAKYNISIFKRIDEIINGDFYIVDSEDEKIANALPVAIFKELVEKFPNTHELKKYSQKRIAEVLRNYLSDLGEISTKYEDYLDKKLKGLKFKNDDKNINAVKILLFKNAYEELEEMLDNSEAYGESVWQEKICGIVTLVFPKYVLAKREVYIGNDGRHNKKPDFILIDSAGFIDILEIKKASKQKIITSTEYRNNYVADRDLSGAIVQAEKYIYTLNHGGTILENRLQKQFTNELPDNLKVRIVNPQGFLIMGRSSGLKEEQLFDLEVIKRQHKNIVDVMTYDDLLARLKNIIDQLTIKMAQKNIIC